MEERREFENPYGDYDPHDNTVVDIRESTKIAPNLKIKLENAVERLQKILDSNLQKHIDTQDPSVYTGTAGIALLYFHHSGLPRKSGLIKVADDLLDQVVQRLKDRKFSMLTGDAGPLAVGAVVKFLQGKRIEAGIYCRRLKHMVDSTLDLRNPEIPDEILYGRAGLLLALLFVRHHLEEIQIEPRFVQLLVSAILASGKAMAEKLGPGEWPPLMYEWHGKKYLGAAHGLCGILHTLILARKCLGGARQEELDILVQQTLNWMLVVLLPSGNLPSSFGNRTDRLVHWCHGAPGLALLLCQAYKSFSQGYKVDHYLEAAKMCADLIWKRGLLRKGCGICHGTAGNAYAFLYLYQITNDEVHLYRALRFAEWCTEPMAHQIRIADRPLSLFEGLAGTIYFLVDVQHPLEAKFPTFV